MRMLYRAYIVGLEGHYVGIRELQCDTDAQAIAEARKLVDGHDVEVWYRGKFLARLQHQPKEILLEPKSD